MVRHLILRAVGGLIAGAGTVMGVLAFTSGPTAVAELSPWWKIAGPALAVVGFVIAARSGVAIGLDRLDAGEWEPAAGIVTGWNDLPDGGPRLTARLRSPSHGEFCTVVAVTSDQADRLRRLSRRGAPLEAVVYSTNKLMVRLVRIGGEPVDDWVGPRP